MPNIRQQEKRVRTAARERLENLRYRSGIKTLTRRLRDTIEAGGADIEAEHKALVRMIDKGASRGAMHKNAAARKKSQAARLVAAGATVVEPKPKAPAKGKAKPKTKSKA
jgi:small subunit ribosomal protein S20